MHLHLIAFELIYPPNYGGVIDVYFRVLSLLELNVKVTLHQFYSPPLNPLPSHLTNRLYKVYYYPRLKNLKGLHPKIPYMIMSRRSDQLLNNITKEPAPTFFEGIHSTYHIDELRSITNEKLAIRAHNIESEYYQELYSAETNPAYKSYFAFESYRIQKIEKSILAKADIVFPISLTEHDKLKQWKLNSHWLPAYLNVSTNNANQNLRVDKSNKLTLLFHGNFLVKDNLNSADWLAKEILPTLPMEFELWLAGKGLQPARFENKRIKTFKNPRSMDSIIQNADIVIIPTKQESGVKLKLLSSIANQKSIVLSTKEGLKGSGFEQIIPTFNSTEELTSLLLSYKENQMKFNRSMINAQTFFRQHYEPIQNTSRILELLFA